jgi:hypothetical protein
MCAILLVVYARPMATFANCSRLCYVRRVCLAPTSVYLALDKAEVVYGHSHRAVYKVTTFLYQTASCHQHLLLFSISPRLNQ